MDYTLRWSPSPPRSPKQKESGQIQLILGPMFSGKSTELIRRVRRYRIAGHQCVLIKYHRDERYSIDKVATHDQQTFSAVKAEFLKQVEDHCLNYSVIGVDEGQFFPDVVEFCEDMANRGKTVVVAALDGTFERKSFGAILGLVPLAEDVLKLKAVCNMCKGEAAFTKRTTDEKEVELIAGNDKYMAVCRPCFYRCESKKEESKPLQNITNEERDNVLIM